MKSVKVRTAEAKLAGKICAPVKKISSYARLIPENQITYQSKTPPNIYIFYEDGR